MLFHSYPELAPALVLLFTAAVTATLAYRAHHNLFDPRVVFVCLYAYLTISPCLYSIFIRNEYHPGLKVEFLGPAIYSCVTAVIGFAVGATLALRGVRAGETQRLGAGSARDQVTNATVRHIILLCSLAAIGLCGYFGQRILASQPIEGMAKADFTVYADAATMRSFRFFAAVSTVCLIYLVVTDAQATRDWRSPTTIGPILLYLVVCFANGERDVLLVIAVWLMANWRKLSKTQVAGLVGITAGWIGISPVLRQFGLGLTSQLSAVESVSRTDWLEQVTHLSPNLHVFTNVVYEVPGNEPYWYGRSLLGALASFVPGEFDLKDDTPTRWFATVYTHQGTAGYAFAQDAEAYLNFGWMGPPLWFCIWGYLLGWTYRRAISPRAKPVHIFIWWYFLAASLFSIRADSRALLKMLVLGFIASKLLWIAAEALHYRQPGSAAKKGAAPRPARKPAPPSRLAAPHSFPESFRG